MALKDLGSGSIAKSLRLIKTDIAQLKRTKGKLLEEHYNLEADEVQDAIKILAKLWN